MFRAVLARSTGGTGGAGTMNGGPRCRRRRSSCEAVERHARRPAAGVPGPGLRRRRRTCAAGSRRCCEAHRGRPASFLERPAAGPVATVDVPPVRRAARHGHRPVQAAGADRRGRHGRGLHGRADRAGPAAWSPSSSSRPGMDTPAGARPLRGRAAGAGADGPPQHRQGPRRRRPPTTAGRTSSWSWSRASRSPGTATSTG